MKEREKFGSRLGFILVSAGCAVGLGNVWKFPYICGENGGAAFVLIYLVFLAILGFPIMCAEFTVGRGSGKGAARAFEELETKGSKWHHFKWVSILGSYILMAFYTMVAGWMLYYCYAMAAGKLAGKDSVQVADYFTGLQDSAGTMTLWMIIVVVLSFGVCSLGVQRGLEKITKVMMICLLALIVVLAVHSLTLDGAMEGVKFYLVPDFAAMAEIGIGNVIFGALSQAFFTLSIGAGSMTIFGSYLGKDRSLLGESLHITILDTFVALMAGLIIIPACFAFGVEPGAGPGLVFITLPNVFNQMTGGKIWESSVFPVYVFCLPVYCNCGFREYYILFNGQKRLEPWKSCYSQHGGNDPSFSAGSIWLQHFVRNTAAWSRNEHHGSGRFHCIQQYSSTGFCSICNVLRVQIWLGLEALY